MTLRAVVWIPFAIALLRCDRADNDRAPSAPTPPPPSVEPTPRRTPEATASPEIAPTSANAPEPSCIVPIPDEPPPQASPAAECPTPPTEPPSLPHGRVRFPDAPGDVRVDVEIARVPAYRQRGLMYRTQLETDSGMLFSWPSESVRSFWMRNTCLPLDMLFISGDGVIVGILEQVPTLNEAPRRVPCPAAHVLEVNAGWVRAHGVRPGQRVDIDS